MFPSVGTTQISYIVRQFVQSQLEDTVNATGFNTLITQTAQSYGYPAFQLNSQATPPNLLLGRYDLLTLSLTQGFPLPIAFPVAILSTAKDDSIGKQAMKITPSTFSGSVMISVDFYLNYSGSSFPPDGEAGFHAVEDAFVGAFCNFDTYSEVPGGVLFNNEVLVEQGNMEWTGSNGWIQHVPCALSFQLVVGSGNYGS